MRACRSFVLLPHSDLMLCPVDRFALHFWFENHVERFGWNRIDFPVLTDADLTEERLIGEAAVLV
ncbi:MAG: hypothetical protein KJ659_05385 [Actinobacteria bacterium]|nr:hypothetical protein [Actinomycetota bacterium]MBU1608542.1 hypothetical protein [Actinomycetota bacterium]MBU2315105.1 hypothetical protein [Actinomycetota bacterium]MBU2384918.1 hypothetical protein [Actinomycetota bacterium]